MTHRYVVSSSGGRFDSRSNRFCASSIRGVDSAQFSAAVSELADESYVGSALTLQTAIGFLITIGSIQLVPLVQDQVGWQWAFVPLVVVPLVGTGAMLWLRSLPEATRLAGGRG